MVQVDVFWSYGLGASMGLAAGRQLVSGPRDLMSNPFFLKTVLFAALVFAPSGAYLLWAFPDWETMQAGSRRPPRARARRAGVARRRLRGHQRHAGDARLLGRRAAVARRAALSRVPAGSRRLPR